MQSQEKKALLEACETDHYATTACMIGFEDGRKILSQKFAWAQDQGLLKESTFDLKGLQMENVENGEAQEVLKALLKVEQLLRGALLRSLP